MFVYSNMWHIVRSIILYRIIHHLLWWRSWLSRPLNTRKVSSSSLLQSIFFYVTSLYSTTRVFFVTSLYSSTQSYIFSFLFKHLCEKLNDIVNFKNLCTELEYSLCKRCNVWIYAMLSVFGVVCEFVLLNWVSSKINSVAPLILHCHYSRYSLIAN